MAYSIRLPDGTLVRNIPDELSPEEAKERIIKAYPEYAPPSGALRQAADIPLQVGRGAVMGVRMLADTLGADNPLSNALRGAEDYLGDLLSAEAKKDQKEIARILKDAEDKGVLDQVKAGLEALTVAPVDLVSQVLGTAVPTIATGMAGAAAKLGAVGIRGLQAGTGAAMGTGLAKGNIYDVVKEELQAAGIDEKTAEERAKAAQEYTGENWDQIILSGLLGGAAALGPLERIFARVPTISPKVAAKNIFARAGAAGVAEAVPEAAQAFQEQVAQNIALQREGFDVPTFRGAVANATLEGLAGFGIGAPIGALEGKPAAQQPPGQQQTEPTPPVGMSPEGIPLPPEEQLTADEEAELQARIAATQLPPPPPPAAPVVAAPQPQPPLPPAPAAVEPEPPIGPMPEVEEEQTIVPPTTEEVTQGLPVTPQTKSLTDQLAQVRAARMDPMLSPDDPEFLELDRREQEILGQIEQMTAGVQIGQVPPAAPPLQLLTPPTPPVITPPAAVTPEITAPEEPVIRSKDEVQAEINRVRQSMKRAQTAVNKGQLPEAEVTKLQERMTALEAELDAAKAGKRKPKYRSAEGKTWIGTGAIPGWLNTKLQQGFELSDFEIRPELGDKSEVEVELEKPPGFGRRMPPTRPPEDYEALSRQIDEAEAETPNLFTVLKGKLTDTEVNDISPEKSFSFLRAGKGKGTELSELVDGDTLSEYLPDEMQKGHPDFDANVAAEYIKDLLRQDPATNPEARLSYYTREVLLKNLRQELADIEQELEPEDVNQLIQEIVAEERAAIADIEAGAIAEQERGPAVPPVTDEFTLTGQTPEELAELQRRELSGEAEAERERLEAEEAARAAAEAERKIADQKRETFQLAPPPSAPAVTAAAPSGDLFGTAGITEQPTRTPRRVGAEPSPIEAAIEESVAKEAMGTPQEALDDLIKFLRLESPKTNVTYDPNEKTIVTEEIYSGETTIKRIQFDAVASLAKKKDGRRGAYYTMLLKDTPTESAVLTFEPMGLKPLDRTVGIRYSLSESKKDVNVPPVEEEIANRMKQLGVDNLEKRSKEVQDFYGVSKPVADAYVRAVRKQAEAIAKISYGLAPSSNFQEAYDEAQKLLNRIKGISKRKETKAEKKEEGFTIARDGIEGYEVDPSRVPNGNDAFQYVVGRVEAGRKEEVYRRRADERGTYGGWRVETSVDKLIPEKPSTKKTREVAEESEIEAQRSTLERLLPKTAGDWVLEKITPYAGNWRVSYTATNASGMVSGSSMPVEATELVGKTDDEIKSTLSERARKNGLKGVADAIKKPSTKKTREVAEGTVVERIELPENLEIRIVKLKDGYSVYQYDLDADQIVMGEQRQFRAPAFPKDQDAYRAAEAFADEMFDKVVPKQPEKMKAAMQERLSRGEDVINNKTPDPDIPADQRLVLMSCCATKNKAMGMGPAMDVYTGVFFQTFKNKVKEGAMPNVRILSAKYGFIKPDQRIGLYDQVMDKATADNFMVDDKLVEDFPSNIKDVLIVGSDQYQRVMKAAVEDLIKAGKIDKDASINVTKGGIGEQRAQLGRYLASLPTKKEPEVKTEVITPSEDKYLGVNASGEKLYERKNGERYRIRMDRADRPSGYPDFGGDLAPVKDDVQTRTVYRTGPSFMDDLGPNVTAADVIRYEQEELGNQDLRVVTDVDLSKIPTSKLEWVTFDRKDAEQYLPEDVDPEDTTEISSRKETFRILAQDSDGGYLIERVPAEAKPQAKKEEKPKAEQFVRGTEEQLKEIKEFAKRYGGSEVAYYDPDKDIGMVLAFGKFDGDPKYIPYIKGIVGRTAFDISVAKFPDVLPYKAELLEVKERLEKAAEKKHQENPFIKFDRGIALSDGMDPKIEGIIREWKDMLGLGGINIYFSTTEDAKKNINNFTGPHRRIGSATIDANERGSMRRMEGGASYYVVFDKSTSTTKMLEVIAHEMGHVHEKVAFDQAPQEIKDKLKAAYEKWLEGRKDKTSREAIQMLRAKTTAKTTDIGQTIKTAEQLDKLDPYWSKFSEWYADQVSRWAVTDEKPVGVVEKFFARLGAALRRFYQGLKGQGYLPDETFVQYLKQVKPTIVETIPGPIKDPVNQDMSSKMQTDLFGSPGEAKDIGEAMEVKGKKKLPPGRSPELTAAAQAVQAGTMTAEEYNKLVDVYKPIPVYDAPLQPATSQQVFDALDVKKREQINPEIPNGTKVGLRLDIPAFNRKGVFVVSIHQKRTSSSPGKVIGYGSVAKAKNVTFGVGNQLKALEIAAGSAKDALQTMEGEYVNTTPEQAFAEAQRAIKDPNYVQVGIDPTRHAYFYDRRTTLPVVAAEEVIQIGNMILAKKPTFGSKSDFLYNIDSSPAQSADDLAANRDSQNQQKVQDLKEMRHTKLDLPKKTQDYKSSEEGQRIIAALNMTGEELEKAIQKQYEGYTADNFMRRARKALDDGEISADVFAVVQSMYMADPKLLDGLRLDVKQKLTPEEIALRRAEGKPMPLGAFAPFERVVYLYTGTKGVTDPMTIRHELTHTLEQLMTPAQRKVLINAYIAALKKAAKKHKDAKSREFFDNVVKYINDPTPAGRDEVNKSLPSLDFYQFTSPSEYWAVNAEKLMAQRLGSAWDRFKKAVRKMFEVMKKTFGFDNEFAVHDVFDKIMSGSRERRLDSQMLGDFIGASNQEYEMIDKTKEDAELVRRYQRPDTPMLDHSPTKRLMVNAVSFAKDEFKNMAENPSDALRMMFNSLNRGVMYLRNKFIWFGSGINEADRIRYNGQVRTAEGLATASLALDNMLRGGNIATQTLFLGGVEFNDKTLQYTAVRKEKNMTKVYEAEARLKEKLGEQLGTNIIQGYLEAKRSRSIKDEVELRKQLVELRNDEIELQVQLLRVMDADPNTTKDERDKADRELRKLFKEYRNEKISFENMKKLAEEKVTMSDTEIDDFISREEAHPELREIIENFNAVNQNLLKFWREVGLLSEARYSALASIKDYVPWYRIMNDEEDVHSPLQSTTRSATNIGREKLFKSGKPSVINDFIVEENQDVFKIQPSRVNAVKLNGVKLKPDAYEALPNGEVRLKVDYKPGDVVVIETQREIENMIDNMTRNVMRMTMNGLRQYAASRIVSEYATRDQKGQIMIFPKVDREKGRFDYIHDGRRYVVEIQDPLLAEAAYGMETVGMEMWKPLAAAANFTRRTITLSPVFQLKQVFKDAPSAALVTGVKNPAALIGGVYKGFVDAIRDSDPAASILREAGIGGFYSPARTPEADVKRQIGIINNSTYDYVIKALDHWGDSSDMAQRIAIYNRVMKETGDEALAMYQSANVINFLRHGSGQLAQALVKTVPFLNAYAQSVDVLYNALVGGGLRGKDRTAALKQLAITGSLLAGTAILYTLLVGDDDDYQKLDDQTKVRNLIIPGTDVILPMNTSAAFFFKAIPELITNKIINEGTKNEVDAARLRTALKESAIDLLLGPTPIPSAVKPVIEISLDYNFFTSRPITPRGMENLDAYQQYDMRTSEAAKLLSGLTGTEANRLLNPMEADHLIRSIFGTAGAMVAWSSNVIGEGSAYRPEMTIKEMPVVGSFLRPEIPRGREDLFYRLKDATDRKYRTFQRIVERGNMAEADAYMKRYPNLIAFYDYTTDMANDLKDINAAIRYIGEVKDPSFTPERKRREIQQLMELKQNALEGIEQFRKEAYAD